MMISLPPPLREFVNSCVAPGKFDDANQVIRVALYLLQQELYRQQREAIIREGLEAIEQGRASDGEEALRKLRHSD